MFRCLSRPSSSMSLRYSSTVSKLDNIRVRRFLLAFLALVGLIGVGTIGFHAFGERWIPSFYRAVVSVSLTGLDSRPESEGAQIFTVILLLSGVAIFLYVAGEKQDDREDLRALRLRP